MEIISVLWRWELVCVRKTRQIAASLNYFGGPRKFLKENTKNTDQRLKLLYRHVRLLMIVKSITKFLSESSYISILQTTAVRDQRSPNAPDCTKLTEEREILSCLVFKCFWKLLESVLSAPQWNSWFMLQAAVCDGKSNWIVQTSLELQLEDRTWVKFGPIIRSSDVWYRVVW
jgi:hypothetical protein